MTDGEREIMSEIDRDDDDVPIIGGHDGRRFLCLECAVGHRTHPIHADSDPDCGPIHCNVCGTTLKPAARGEETDR
jgi:hypothetical protein